MENAADLASPHDELASYQPQDPLLLRYPAVTSGNKNNWSIIYTTIFMEKFRTVIIWFVPYHHADCNGKIFTPLKTLRI